MKSEVPLTFCRNTILGFFQSGGGSLLIRFAIFLFLSGIQVAGAPLLQLGFNHSPRNSEVTIPLTFSNSADVVALQADIVFNSNNLSFRRSFTDQVQTIASGEIAPGKVRLVVYSLNNVAFSNGALASLRFFVSSNAPGGPQTVVLTNVIMADLASASVPGYFGDGSIEVLIPPVITDLSSGVSTNQGADVDFHVNATGTEPLFYQWRFNGIDLFGATNASLQLLDIQTANAGYYSVIVSNIVGAVLSHTIPLALVGDCSFSIDPSLANFPSTGGTFAVSVTSPGCAWQTINSNSWISFPQGGAGIGNGSVTFAVEQNLSNQSRSATFVVAGKTVTVTQSGAIAATSIVGRTITFTNISGGNGFATSGARLYVTATTNNSFRSLTLKGATNNTSGKYTYTRLNSTIGQITTNNTETTLFFSSRSKGTFVATNAASRGWQAGTFAIVPTGPDYNNDGRVDIAFQNSNDRKQAAWNLRGTNYLGNAALSGNNAPAAGFKLVGSADFNRDARTDLLFQNSSGQLLVWYLKGGTRPTSAFVRNGISPGAPWIAVGVADFNNDGRLDILFQHTDSRLMVWYLTGNNGATYLTAGSLRNATKVGTGWRAVGASDFNGDGSPDVLFQSNPTARMMVWYMDNRVFISASPIANNRSAVGFRASAVTDLNGDGQSDILFQHTNNKILVWYMNGKALLGSGYLRNGTPITAGWRLSAPR